jgi:hypothetical protein
MNSPTKRCLFVLHEGIGSTIFNSQVLEHSKGLIKNSIECDILAFDTLNKTWKVSNVNLGKAKISNPDINIILKKGVNIYYPFSVIFNFILLVIFFLKNKDRYTFIHARTDYTAFLSILSKPFHNLPVYWDCRGDSVSELKDSLSRKNFFIKLIGFFYLVNFDRFVIYVVSKKCDGAIFVSEALLNLFKSKLVTNNYEIIPCPVSENLFFFDLNLRFSMRKKYNFTDENVVYLYSGSMVAYQSLDEQYLLYERLLENPLNVIIIATSDPEIATYFFKDLISKRLIITSISFEEMNSYYNLADFAFLIRERKQLNYVASPTKFGEYCLTGLPVIMTDTVNQAYEFSNKLGNYVSAGNLSFIPISNQKRLEIAYKSLSFYSREVLINKYLALYSYN